MKLETELASTSIVFYFNGIDAIRPAIYQNSEHGRWRDERPGKVGKGSRSDARVDEGQTIVAEGQVGASSYGRLLTVTRIPS